MNWIQWNGLLEGQQNKSHYTSINTMKGSTFILCNKTICLTLGHFLHANEPACYRAMGQRGKWISRPDTLMCPNAALVILVRLQLLCLTDPSGLTWLIMKWCIWLRGLWADWAVRWSSHCPPSRSKDSPMEDPVYSWGPITHLLHDCSSGCHFRLITQPPLNLFSKLWSHWKGS